MHISLILRGQSIGSEERSEKYWIKFGLMYNQSHLIHIKVCMYLICTKFKTVSVNLDAMQIKRLNLTKNIKLNLIGYPLNRLQFHQLTMDLRMKFCCSSPKKLRSVFLHPTIQIFSTVHILKKKKREEQQISFLILKC